MKTLKINYNEYKGLVSEICRKISVSGWKPDCVVGITRGGLFPAVMISHYFGVPCHTLKVSLREGTDNDCESNLWLAEQAFGIVNYDQQGFYGSRWDIALRKNILIVDDINDSGATLNWIMDDWESGCYPNQDSVWNTIWNNNVKFAVVVDNLNSDCDVSMDYSGMEINKFEEDIWVEFPYENWWR